MLEDKTYKIQTDVHNDAVIYVTEQSYIGFNDKAKLKTNVIAVIPINITNGTDDEFVKLVDRACTSLSYLYQDWPDGEIKIHYVINSHQFVNV